MATKKARKTQKVKTTFARGGAIAKRASKIYESWKEDYKDAFRTAHGDTKKIQAIASDYRKRHGATARKRWGNAMKIARKHTASRQTSLFQ